VPAFDSKLSAVAFGVFIPFFFVVSGMRLDVDALFASVSGVVKLFVFFGLFLVVRGTPALVLYRGVLDRCERVALVGAAVLSTLAYPILGLRLRGDVPVATAPAAAPSLVGDAP
jgi:Kef-type K+ transport system membrane component KefB